MLLLCTPSYYAYVNNNNHCYGSRSTTAIQTQNSISSSIAASPNDDNCVANINASATASRIANTRFHRALTIRGGAGVNYVSPDAPTGYTKCPVSKLTNFMASFWGAGGVCYVLMKSVKRVAPIALEPIKAGTLTPFQVALYAVTCAYFAYAEGYKGFQKRFSPMVVARSMTLKPFQSTPFHHYLLAPFYSMGLFHATKKRKIVSWGMTLGIGAIVALVKRLPYPWRNIIDGGVVVGLTWGAISIMLNYIKAVFITGVAPEGVDPALP